MKTNKVIASALAFIMATTVAAGSVYAAGEKVTISAGKQEAAPGAEFSIDIQLKDVPASGIMACEFALSYDASALTITGVTAGEIANTGADAAESDISGECPSFYADYSTAGTINLTWSTGLTDAAYWIAEDGVFATIKGTVSDSASGEYPIEIVPISRDDISGTNSSILMGYVDADGAAVEYETAVSNGAITVTSETKPSETTTTTTTAKPTETTTTTTTASSTTNSGIGDDTTMIGDVNLDGIVSLVDVVYLNKSMANAITLNAQAKANANTCNDGTAALNGADTTALLKYVVRLIDALPVIP